MYYMYIYYDFMKIPHKKITYASIIHTSIAHTKIHPINEKINKNWKPIENNRQHSCVILLYSAENLIFLYSFEAFIIVTDIIYCI